MKADNSKKDQNNMSRIITISLLLGVFSCTKKVPYESISNVEKDQVLSKSLIDTKAEYLYSSSQQNASRSASDALPFSAGDNKRVKIEMLEKSIRIVETEKDKRFQDNKANNKILLEIPVDHVQYRCAKDRYGECTNSEEEAKDISWENRDQVKIKFEEAKSGELDFLPILSSQTFGDNCYTEVSSRLLEAKVEQDALNFRVERVFKTNINCLPEEAMSASDSSVTSVYHYSLVKTSSVLTSGFTKVDYPVDSIDENTFGFFTTKYADLDVDNNLTQRSLKQLMNHWNPQRSVIEYHLSDEFAKPENKKIKELTYQTFENLNKGLAEAGVKFKLNLNEPSGKVPGDIRNSMIVLVEDPVASSVIGYGPQTEDPLTGEIISARTIMFLGTIKKYIKYTYDEVLREKKSLSKVSILKTNHHSLQLDESLKLKVEKMKNKKGVQTLTETQNLFKKSLRSINQKNSTQIVTQLSTATHQKVKVTEDMVRRAAKNLNNYTARKNDLYNMKDVKSRLKYLNEVKNCAYTPNLNSVASKVSGRLLSKISDDAKPWVELSEREREKVIDIILPEIWIPTLIHEIGHNLGLRHNFKASEDAANHYSSDELSQKGIDHLVPFSSVMDYGNDLKTLTVLGKYDIAALRFGYLRQAEVVNQDKSVQTVSVDQTLESTLAKLNSDLTKESQIELKPYGYCTDENTGLNAGCKRFDLGVTKTEITQNLINDYLDAYEKRNLRQDRLSFSLFNEHLYAQRMNDIFEEIRFMMETKEIYQNLFQISDSDKVWSQYEFLSDIKQATELGGLFMTNVVLTPNVHCAIAPAKTPNKVVTVMSLKALNELQGSSFIDCFQYHFYDPSLAEQYLIVAQAGKHLNSVKDLNSKIAGESEVDVRGIWPDKVAALNFLTKRSINVPSYDKFSDNYLNTDVTRKAILEMTQAVLTDNAVGTLTFKTKEGQEVDLEVNYDLDSSQLIEKPFLATLVENYGQVVQDFYSKLLLGINSNISLQKLVAKKVAFGAYDSLSRHVEDQELYESLKVSRYDANVSQQFAKDTKTIDIDQTKFVANSKNTWAQQAIVNLENANLITQISEEALNNIIALKQEGTNFPPASLTDSEKAVFNLDLEVLLSSLDGSLKSSVFYTELLKGLPIAN